MADAQEINVGTMKNAHANVQLRENVEEHKNGVMWIVYASVQMKNLPRFV